MASLEISEKKTLKWEGGYCNVAGDAGGETIFGIAKNANPDSKIWAILDKYKAELEPLTKAKYKSLENMCLADPEFKAEMDTIYRKLYWDKIKGDEIQSQDVANILYDFAVNSGPGRAIKHIQRILGVAADGALGPKTVAAINASDAKDLCNKLCDSRTEYFKKIAENGENHKFLNGWLNRVKDFYVK